MKKNTIIILLISLLFSSCMEVLDVQLPQEAPKLVLNGIIVADSAWKVQILSSKSLQKDSNRYSFVKNALVKIYSEGQFITQLQYQQNGIYLSNENLSQAGRIYTITAQAQGFPPVKATDTIPDKINIITDSVSGPYSDEFYSNYYYYSLQFRLPQNKTIYYGMVGRNYAEKSDGTKNWIENSYLILEYITPNGTFNRFAGSTIFTNKNEDNQIQNLSIKAIPSTDAYSTYIVRFYQYYYLVNYSYAYYQYFKTLKEYAIDDYLIEEKAPVYSNIEGGYGIFASKNMGEQQLLFTKNK